MKSKLKKTTRAGKGKEDPYERILDLLIIASIVIMGVILMSTVIKFLTI